MQDKVELKDLYDKGVSPAIEAVALASIHAFMTGQQISFLNRFVLKNTSMGSPNPPNLFLITS